MTIFISHIHEEASIAEVIKNAIEASFGEQLKVFTSGDPNDVPAGVNWLDQLQASLGSASAVLVLCSKVSRDRPWVNFETGYARIKGGIPVIPICHSGLSKSDLPIQIATFQALNVSDSDFVFRLINGLAVCLRLSAVPHIDEEAIRTIWRSCFPICVNGAEEWKCVSTTRFPTLQVQSSASCLNREGLI